MTDTDWTTLANIIREVDGNHDLGAGELAERILAHPKAHAALAAGVRPPEPPPASTDFVVDSGYLRPRQSYDPAAPPPAAPGLREAAQAAYLELLAAPFVHDGADESSEAITEREERLTALDDLRAALAETPGGEK